jgi:DNA-binding winged helix-turn-helix (wHTH) protein
MKPETLSFGDFSFDPESGLLLRRRRPVHLTRKAARFLGALIRKRPEPVSKPDLFRLLWPDTVVTEGNLTNLAFEVRRALGDDGQAYVATVHGFGYAFVAEVRNVPAALQWEAEPGVSFSVVTGDRQISLLEGENWIGRSSDCRVRVDCTRVSRHHARIVVESERATLEDGPSRNGTFLGGKRLTKPALLEFGDEIRIGSARLTFRFARPESPTDVD